MADNKTTFTHDNGDEVESNVSGFKGIITSRSDRISGCNRYFVLPKVNKAGKMREGYWHDEDELDNITVKKVPRGNNERGGMPSRSR